MIESGTNGLLVDFFDVDGLADTAEKVLATPEDYRPLGQAGVRMIQEHYSLEICLPRMLALYQEVFERSHPVVNPAPRPV
jgi:glycosyltransferase involved in cell wall biosynthesis